jgi:hypothetical protein
VLQYPLLSCEVVARMAGGFMGFSDLQFLTFLSPLLRRIGASSLKLRSTIGAVWIAGSEAHPHCHAATVTVSGILLRGGIGVNPS